MAEIQEVTEAPEPSLDNSEPVAEEEPATMAEIQEVTEAPEPSLDNSEPVAEVGAAKPMGLAAFLRAGLRFSETKSQLLGRYRGTTMRSWAE